VVAAVIAAEAEGEEEAAICAEEDTEAVVAVVMEEDVDMVAAAEGMEAVVGDEDMEADLEEAAGSEEAVALDLGAEDMRIRTVTTNRICRIPMSIKGETEECRSTTNSNNNSSNRR